MKIKAAICLKTIAVVEKPEYICMQLNGNGGYFE